MTYFQIELGDRDQAAADLISGVGEQLQCAFAERKKDRKITQESVAKSLGVNRSHVHRYLSGYNNLTLRSLSDFAWALDKCVHVRICDLHQEVTVADNQGNNFYARPVFADSARVGARPVVQAKRARRDRIHASAALGQ